MLTSATCRKSSLEEYRIVVIRDVLPIEPTALVSRDPFPFLELVWVVSNQRPVIIRLNSNYTATYPRDRPVITQIRDKNCVAHTQQSTGDANSLVVVGYWGC